LPYKELKENDQALLLGMRGTGKRGKFTGKQGKSADLDLFKRMIRSYFGGKQLEEKKENFSPLLISLGGEKACTQREKTDHRES